MKATMYLMVILVLACAVPVLAQGPFTDVPADHWAYDAVNQLQKDGILIGYPDGTFGGKRTITRYEFATALARINLNPGGGPGGLTKSDVEGMLGPYALKTDIPTTQNLANLATKADVDALKKLVDEFRDEIAALGVDVDALKRDVAALGARVDAIEAEMKRVKLFGDVAIFAIAGGSTQNTAIDLDNRTLPDGLWRNIGVVKDFDLKVVGRVSDCVTANATINYGNYLNYLNYVDDYSLTWNEDVPVNYRPTGKSSVRGGGSTTTSSLSDSFFPYYLYVDAGIGKGALTVGRFPLQFTPYTLKMIDVDSYTTIMKTDSGNYPVDGVKLAINLWGVDWTWFAAKNNENDYLKNGLTGQPNTFVGVMHQMAEGNAVGGLTQVTQSAGVRAVVSLPASAVLGVTYYQAWDGLSYANLSGWDQARVYGADLAIGIPWVSGLNFAGSWTKCDTLADTRVAGNEDVDYLNIAWDGKLGASIGKLGIDAGYKSIGRNFAAAGYWDKIGPWANPVNIKGPYVDFNYPVLENLKIALNGEVVKIKDNADQFDKDDEITKAEAAVKWGFSKSCAVDVSYQYVKINPTAEGAEDSTLSYLTVGVDHQLSPNAGVKVGYQMLNGDLGDPGADYRGGLGVVQFGVSF